MENNEQFSERIRLLRTSLNLTQSVFAKKIGLSQNTITKYENGLRSPNNIVVNSICREYCVNEEWLRTGKGEMFNKDSQLEIQLGKLAADPDEFKRALVNNICKLSDEEWETLKKIVLSTCEDINKNKRDR